MNKTRRWKRPRRRRRDRTRERVERARAIESAASRERALVTFADSLGVPVEKFRSRWRRVEIGMAIVGSSS